MKTKNKVQIAIFMLPAILLMIVFIFFPIILNFYYSMFEWSAFSKVKIFVGLKNYTTMFNDKYVLTAIRNNSIFAVISIIFQVGFAMVLAAALENKFARRFQPFFRTVYFLPSLISITVTGLLFQCLLSPRIGIVNPLLEFLNISVDHVDLLGNSSTAIYAITMVSQWQYVGYGIMLFLVAMQNIPPEYYEAATVDGANGIQQFIYITIPQIKGTTMVVTIITLIGAFKVFDEVYVMTGGGPGRSSEVLATYLYRSGFRNDVMGYASAIGVLIFIITFVLSIIQIKISKIDISD